MPPARGVWVRPPPSGGCRWQASRTCAGSTARPPHRAREAMTYKTVAPGDHAFGVRTTRGSAASSDERVYRWRLQPAPKATGLSVTPSPLAICAYPRAVTCDQSTPQLNGSLTAPPGAPTLLTVTVACTAAPCGPRTYFTNVVEVPPGQTAIGPLPLTVTGPARTASRCRWTAASVRTPRRRRTSPSRPSRCSPRRRSRICPPCSRATEARPRPCLRA